MASLPIWLRFGSGSRPNPDVVTAMVADRKAYSVTSNILGIAANATPANQTAAMSLFNPVSSGVVILLYGVIISSDVAGIRTRFQKVTVDPAYPTVLTPVNRYLQPTPVPSAMSATASTASGIALPSTNVYESYMTGIVPIIPPGTVVDLLVDPGTGINLVFNEETASTAANVAATFIYAEFASS